MRGLQRNASRFNTRNNIWRKPEAKKSIAQWKLNFTKQRPNEFSKLLPFHQLFRKRWCFHTNSSSSTHFCTSCDKNWLHLNCGTLLATITNFRSTDDGEECLQLVNIKMLLIASQFHAYRQQMIQHSFISVKYYAVVGFDFFLLTINEFFRIGNNVLR